MRAASSPTWATFHLRICGENGVVEVDGGHFGLLSPHARRTQPDRRDRCGWCPFHLRASGEHKIGNLRLTQIILSSPHTRRTEHGYHHARF